MTTLVLSVPPRKRTRIACDSCRRRKTKCDGSVKEDCSACAEVNLTCTYGHSARRARGPRYVAFLEEKVEDLESRVRGAAGSSQRTDDGRPLARPMERNATSSHGHNIARLGLAVPTTSCSDIPIEPTRSRSPPGPPDEDVLETINCAPKFAFDNSVTSQYRGTLSGMEVLRHLHSLCYEFVHVTIDHHKELTANLMKALDRPLPIHYLSLNSMTNAFLPSLAKLNQWTEIAFCRAFTLWPFIDRQLFQSHVNRLFEQESFGRDINDRDYLGLIYAVLALGQRYDPEHVLMEGSVEGGDSRGLNYFAAALDLVPLAECNRSVTAVQTVLCLALYLKSISAQGMMHTYVSTAVCAAHQLGLHVVSDAHFPAERERVARQRLYTALRILDAYVTTCVGLPRSSRANGMPRETLRAPYIDCHEMLIAADANAALMEILAVAVEGAYLTSGSFPIHGPHAVRYSCLDEVDRELEQWTRKFPIVSQIAEDAVSAQTTLQLLLGYSQCFVLLTLYSPFTHHFVRSPDNRSARAAACGLKSVEAAIRAVYIASELNDRGLLMEAYPLTVDVLVTAATALLVVNLGATNGSVAAIASEVSKTAKTLLMELSPRSTAVVQCLTSLTPLYESLKETKRSSRIDPVMQDFTLFAI